MKMCLNWKVLAGLGAAGVGVYLVAPGVAAAALPLLLLAVCQLSMLLMMKGMQRGKFEAQGKRASQEAEADPTREKQVTRLRAQQADLADRIETLEREEELPPARNGKGR